jgi:hypothetical protein
MNVFHSFITSLYLPQKMARFRFQRMKKAISYVFILMFIASIPGAMDVIFSDRSQTEIPIVVFILMYFLIYYLLFSFLGFLSVTVLAAAGIWFSHILGRKQKLPYNQLWIMSAYAITMPALLYTLAATLQMNGFPVFIIISSVAAVILLRLIIFVPKPGFGR